MAQPGENGTTVAPGSGANAAASGNDDGWGLHPNDQPDDMDGMQPEQDDYSPLIAEETPPDQGQEPDGEVGQQQESGQPEPEGTQQEPTEPDERDSRIAEMEATMATMQQALGFYQQQYNDFVARSRGPQGPQQPAAQNQPQPPVPGQQMPPQPGQLPPDIAGPGNWDLDDGEKFQSQLGRWTETRADQIARQAFDQAYQQRVDPMFNAIGNRLGALMDAVVRTMHPDFDEVYKDAISDAYVLDPTGKNAIGVKNQALVDYWSNSPFPHMAIYQHGLAKKTPQKIKSGVQQATQKTLQKIAQKPKGPTQVKGGRSADEVPELDWNTPPEVAEKILHKKGVL